MTEETIPKYRKVMVNSCCMKVIFMEYLWKDLCKTCHQSLIGRNFVTHAIQLQSTLAHMHAVQHLDSKRIYSGFVQL